MEDQNRVNSGIDCHLCSSISLSLIVILTFVEICAIYVSHFAYSELILS